MVDRLGRALLYEGYVLYPYRASSLKNRNRATFGTLYPESRRGRGEGPVSFCAECLVREEAPTVRVSVRFLQLGEPATAELAPFDQAMERRLDLSAHALGELARGAARVEEETLSLDGASGLRGEAVTVRVSVSAAGVADGLHRLSVRVENATPDPGDVPPDVLLRHALVSAHAILECEGGEFVSLLEPEADVATAAARCRNEGVFPVLVGAPGEKRTLLASPIILYDYPKIAEESPGDLFDATEIDEILSLRILTLTEEERAEAMRTDPRAKALLERTAGLDEETFARLHGAWRTFERTAHARRFDAGSRVVLRPRPGGDVLDLSLAGEAATVLSVEEDAEGRVYYAVAVDADPGRDLGALGQPGHRFFFQAEELEAAP
ncbi:MAG TPA: hypothetical protein VHE30_12010 [Polyangiaceae bacterium]|nr:hypothetical protein [Polyangiaceae bacterium]